jgi:hypothetical protein
MNKHKDGIWISIQDETPEIIEQDDGEHSSVVLILGKDGCIWLAYTDGEIWISMPDTNIYFGNDYVEYWMKIPRRKKNV